MSYPVGYRRPPPSGQFKKGTSGNPKGRPKGSKNFHTLLEQELSEKLVITENGKRKSITRLQAMVKRMVAGALQGDRKALLTLIDVLRRTVGFDSAEPDALLPDNYEEILEAYVEARNQAKASAALRVKGARK